MHGYFMDIRLYRKAKLVNEPFNFEEFKRSKIKEKLEKERESRARLVITRKLPAVNAELAKRLMEDKEDTTAKKKAKESSASLLADSRFDQLFTNPDFEINTQSDEFKLLNPVVQKVNEKKLKRPAAGTVQVQDGSTKAKRAAVNDYDSDKRNESSSSDQDEDISDSSSDDEHQWSQSVKDNYKQIQKDQKMSRKPTARLGYLKFFFY